MGNTSPSIEPFRANAYRQDTLSGAFLNKNKHLDKIIKERYDNPEEVWKTVIANEGSAQHLEKLSDHEKDVFKTAMEVDQLALIRLATDRAEFIDQGQSVNIFVPPDVSIKELHRIHYTAWRDGLKGLYYCRSAKMKTTDKVSQQIERVAIKEEEECIACGS
jgi:ribonucleoside-diphosphate reductase alpha chain